MPLDGHSHLVAQGWSGKGNGLREGSISRPIAIPQKRTLAGLGKDRDEAFPFWDHLFSAASKTIQIKCTSSDEDSDAESPGEVSATLTRTTTGILSNRRPVSGTPATTSGTSTPDYPPSSIHKASLLSTAKREAAKKGLYSRFFRGPVLGPDVYEDMPDPGVGQPVPSTSTQPNADLPVSTIPLLISEDTKENKRKGGEGDEGTGSEAIPSKRKKEKKRDEDDASEVTHKHTKKKRKDAEVDGIENSKSKQNGKEDDDDDPSEERRDKKKRKRDRGDPEHGKKRKSKDLGPNADQSLNDQVSNSRKARKGKDKADHAGAPGKIDEERKVKKKESKRLKSTLPNIPDDEKHDLSTPSKPKKKKRKRDDDTS